LTPFRVTNRVTAEPQCHPAVLIHAFVFTARRLSGAR
jgi:hypothetical protein